MLTRSNGERAQAAGDVPADGELPIRIWDFAKNKEWCTLPPGPQHDQLALSLLFDLSPLWTLSSSPPFPKVTTTSLGALRWNANAVRFPRLTCKDGHDAGSPCRRRGDESAHDVMINEHDDGSMNLLLVSHH